MPLPQRAEQSDSILLSLFIAKANTDRYIWKKQLLLSIEEVS